MDFARILSSYESLVAFIEAMPSESASLEFKERLVSPRDLAGDVAAMANAHGGIIVLGVKDPRHGRQIVGVEADDRKVDAFSNGLSALTQPPVEVEVRLLRGSEKSLVALAIPRSRRGPHEQLVSDAHRFPVRRGATTKSLTLSELEQLQREATFSTRSIPLQERHPLIQPHLAISMPAEWRGLMLLGGPAIEPPRNGSIRGYDHLSLTEEVLTLAPATLQSASAEFEPVVGGFYHRAGSKMDPAYLACMFDDGQAGLLVRERMLGGRHTEADDAIDAFEFGLRWIDAALWGLRLGPRAIVQFGWRLDCWGENGDAISREIDFANTDLVSILHDVFEHAERRNGRVVSEPEHTAALGVRPDPRKKWGAGAPHL